VSLRAILHLPPDTARNTVVALIARLIHHAVGMTQSLTNSKGNGLTPAAPRIAFYGAAGEVTGSAYLVETARARVLVDFGLFQGFERKQELNRVPDGLDPARLDAVVVTHAHLDHVGRLPLLVKAGYKGPVYCTPVTIELAELVLRDSAKVQAQDIERINRKRMRADEPPVEPLYTAADVDRLMPLFRPVEYEQTVEVARGIRARFVEAGHILGSASIQLQFDTGNGMHCAVFSGDLGPRGAPILKDAEGFHRADTVVLESTYGDRDHKPIADTVAEFEQIVADVVGRRGKMLVPTFAVGRAQLLLYLLALMFRHKTVPKFPIYVDSPMAIEATKIYFKHIELFDDDFQAIQRERPLAQDLDTVVPVATADESKALNECTGPCLIMAGSGMCTGGRILHHLKQNLWRPETSVIIVGYQADGTLGRLLVERVPHVTIFGEKIAVKAKIHTLGGFSAHAGQTDLVRWFDQLAHVRPDLILTHGEPGARDTLASLLEQRHGIRARKPAFGEVLELRNTGGSLC